MTTASERRPSANGAPEYVSYRQRRRRNLGDRLLEVLIGGAYAAVVMAVVALAVGALWVIVVLGGDIVRRLGG